MEKTNFNGRDGKTLSLCVWDTVENPVGIVQIVHGMAEHVSRYDEMARYLNSRGFIVAGDDHRAHGETDPQALGLAGEGDLFEKTVADELDISDMLRKSYKLPLVVFGHSYGSFVTQRYLTIDAGKIAGCVLCGSAFMHGPAVAAGSFLADMKARKHKDEPGRLFAKMTFASYDKKFGGAPGAWLNRDAAEVEKYRNDPLCDFTCSNGFYKYFFRGLKTIAAADLSGIPDALPMLIVSGSDDCVGGRGKLVKKLAARYTRAGLKPIVKLYPGARHELAVETCRQTFFGDVADFALAAVKDE